MSAAALLLAAALALPSGPEANRPEAWEEWAEARLEAPVECYKHEGAGPTPHGSAEGDTVTLHEHDPEWFGNGWALLVIKAGQVRDVHLLPQPGTFRTSTGKDVSHWIICKGEFPPPPVDPPPTTTTTTTTPPPEHPATPVCLVPGKGIYDHDDPRCVPDPAPAPEAPAPPPEGPAPEPPAPARLPETGTGTRLALLGGATLSIGLLVELVTRYVLRRTPR